MPEPRPHTGPVTLPADPKAVADRQVADLASLGTLNRAPTAREYEHAALDTALSGGAEEEVYAVLAHLDAQALTELGQATIWLQGAIEESLRDRRAPKP